MATILCVEDNDDSQFMLHRRLSRAGFDVKLARDGAEGVGCEAARRLKSQPETRHIPIVVLSSHHAQEFRDRAMAAGCDEYETKPADFGKLIERIRALVRPASGG
jgi:CheY-like chemotaxis protein